jgi:hypothetical protein
MRLIGDAGFLEFERSEVGDGTDPDLLLNVTVKVGNYSAADQCWIAADDLDGFCSELQRLESLRQGRAVLIGASPDDLQLDFHSTDSVGHMGVKGHLGWRRSEEFPLQLEFGFAFESDRLPLLVEFFEGLVRP